MNMLLALKYDDSISAGELADVAGVTRSTAREHLLKLIDSRLVTERSVGRFRYYSLADGAIAEILDGFEAFAAQILSSPSGPLATDAAMLHARCCGDHLAGEVGARLAERFIARGFILQSTEGVELTEDGAALLVRLDVHPGELQCRPRRFLYLCPDWRRSSFHLGGAVGAALLRTFISRNWMRVDRKSRRVDLTPIGYGGLRAELGLDIRPPV
jgi:DNA-binding transcriptional ArsR family regulator